MPKVFYGWWIVAACLLIAVVAWSLGVFGLSVYLYAISTVKGWSIGLISTAVTVFYLISALSSIAVGTAVARLGPRVVITVGALAMACGVAGAGQVTQPWHVHASFLVMGFGYACLSVTALTTTLAPWFERHQGRAVSTTMLGASVGGMVGVPSLLFGIQAIGYPHAMAAASLVALVVIIPMALFVLRHRPQDMGLLPDGAAARGPVAQSVTRVWARSQAVRTSAFLSVVAAFGLGLLVQVGFLTHHVALVAPTLGAAGAAATVSATAAAAFIGRLALARYADGIDVRVTTCGLLLVGALSLTGLALLPHAAAVIATSVVYGFTIGNITTLSPIIIRREFGSESFGAVYGVAGMGIGLASGLGPSFYGLLHDATGGYAAPLLIGAAIDVVAATIIVRGARTSPVHGVA